MCTCAQKRFEFLLNDNVWRNFTVVYDGTGLANTKLYVNGILHTDNYCNDNVGIATELATNVTSGGISFGKRNDNLGFLDGALDDIAIYNRALTPAEITQLYTAAEEPVATCPPLAPNLQNGLVGYWPFCGNANDESGNGNNGVVNGATLAEDRFGNAGSAYSFDGVGAHINCTNNIGGAYSSFSVVSWLKVTDYPSENFGKILDFGGSVGRFFLSNSYLDGFEFGVTESNINNDALAQITSFGSEDQWLQVAGVWESDQYIALYINGVLVAYNSIFPVVNEISIAPNSQLLFGMRYNESDYFNGTMDDIAIWNRALTQEEIAQLYSGTAAPCNLIASETQDTPVEVSGSAQMYVTLNATDYNMQWQTNAAGLGWMDVQDNNTYTGSQTQNLLVSNATLANHEQPFRIIVTDSICNDTSDVALLLVNNTCTAYDTITTTVEVFDTLTIENVVEVYDTLTIYNTIDIFDTTTVTVEVFDTITNVFDVFDTTTIYLQVDIFDTLFIDVYDTTYVQQTIDVYDTTYVTLTDTTYIQVIDTAYVTVTDTLLIDITFVGFEGQPSWLNTVLVFPNPTNDHITIDYGNFALMAGYNTVITDAAGATVYSSAVNTQQATIDINAWGAAGVYFMSVYDVNGTVVAVRQIELE